MIVVDTKKNVYSVLFFDNKFAEWSKDFFNAGALNTVYLDDLYTYAYECETDISELIEYMNDFLNKEGEFIDDTTDVSEAYYRIRYVGKYEK